MKFTQHRRSIVWTDSKTAAKQIYQRAKLTYVNNNLCLSDADEMKLSTFKKCEHDAIKDLAMTITNSIAEFQSSNYIQEIIKEIELL